MELTPTGRGAVAVILVAGPNATQAVDGCFVSVSGKQLAEIALGRIAFGRWGTSSGEELVVCRRHHDRVEVHPHGGVTSVSRVIADLIHQGCQPTDWRTWERQQSADPLQAAARIALADAPTQRSAQILLDQYLGALRTAIREIEGFVGSGDAARGRELIDVLLARRNVGLHLTSPWRVVVAGPPNVGKSSLANAILGFERAIVVDQPGTTRDVVTAVTALQGWPVEIRDTAGLHDASDPVEAAGVAKARQEIEAADLVLDVHDASAPRQTDGHPSPLPSSCPSDRVIHVLNKVDLVRREPTLPTGRQSIAVSALTRHGIDTLGEQIVARLIPQPPSRGTAVPFTESQITCLQLARDSLSCQDTKTAAHTLHSEFTAASERR